MNNNYQNHPPPSGGGSVGSERSAQDVLAKMMRDQERLARTMQGMDQNSNYQQQQQQYQQQQYQQQDDPAEVARLAREKEELANQLMQLQQQLNNQDGASVGNRSHRSQRSQRSSRGGDARHDGPTQVTLPGETLRTVDVGSLNTYDDVNSVSSRSVGSRSVGNRSHASNRSGRSARSNRSNRSGRSARSGAESVKSGKSIQSGRSTKSSLSKKSKSSKSKKKDAYNGFEPPLEEFVREEWPEGSKNWKRLSRAMTFVVPDACINKPSASQKQAWREKVAICMIAVLLSAFVVGGIGFLPIYFCRSSTKFSQTELQQKGEGKTTMYGNIYDLGGFQHPMDNRFKEAYRNKDASHLFPRIPLASMPAYCFDMTKEIVLETTQPTCVFSDEDLENNAFCHRNTVGMSSVYETFRDYRSGTVVLPDAELQALGMTYVMIRNRIYNVTQYVDNLRDPQTNTISKDPAHPNAYLQEALHLTIVNKLNQDATKLYDDVFEGDEYLHCIDELFFETNFDDRYDPVCASIGIFMYLFLFFVVGMLAVQVICSLVYLARKHRVFMEEDLQAAVMIMVPCYNEGEGELMKTITSCVQTTYPVENKVMCVVADGMVTGADEVMSTPEICAKLLGFQINLKKDDQHHYRSLGKKRDNYAAVYTGTYSQDVDGKPRELKYIVIVKTGGEAERGTAKPGNRGKRDSQLVLAGMFNRIHHGRQPCELDMALVKAMFSMGLPAKDVEYLMTIDADTRVDSESINHMVYAMEHDKMILACCGETQVDNKNQSWVTAIQIFEYYSSHHLKKAFESVFGCVTCLPGCFTMYRVFTDEMKCLIANDLVFKDYARNDIPSLHEKNLFELGEDRMLTTLLLQHFPGMRLSFVPEAVCWTIVPHTLWILLSQRRRWINSTFHNMYELLKVETMCGLCFFSMKTVVIMDLIVTMILPASLIYIGYLTYLLITQPETLDRFVLMFYGISFGMQMLSFLVRSRWDYLWWFFVFTFAGIPVFYFLLPVYAFTHMDDFSWGKTRKLGGDAEEEKSDDEGDEDEKKEEGEDKDGGDDTASVGSKRSQKSGKSAKSNKTSKSKTKKKKKKAEDSDGTEEGSVPFPGMGRSEVPSAPVYNLGSNESIGTNQYGTAAPMVTPPYGTPYANGAYANGAYMMPPGSVGTTAPHMNSGMPNQAMMGAASVNGQSMYSNNMMMGGAPMMNPQMQMHPMMQPNGMGMEQPMYQQQQPMMMMPGDDTMSAAGRSIGTKNIAREDEQSVGTARSGRSRMNKQQVDGYKAFL